MNILNLRKPVPLWFSFFRLVILVTGLVWIAYTSDFKPVTQEIAKTVSEVNVLIQKAAKSEQVAVQNVTTTPIQQSNNGAAQ